MTRAIAPLALAFSLTTIPATGQERVRISINAGQQASTTTVTQGQTFDRYFEQGSFTFEPMIPAALIFDGGAIVRVWRKLYAGAAVSFFDRAGTGTVTARVPHPLQFNKPRTSTGEIADATRREVGQHIVFGWNFSIDPGPRARAATRGLDFLVFGGPSIFATDQLFVTSLNLSLDKEVFPFDELPFPGAQMEVVRENVWGYNGGVDMTWRFNRNVGVGLLLRYSQGTKAFAPLRAQPTEVTVGGLHAGGGLRVLFGYPRPGRKLPGPPFKPPPSKPAPPKQPPKGR